MSVVIISLQQSSIFWRIYTTNIIYVWSVYLTVEMDAHSAVSYLFFNEKCMQILFMKRHFIVYMRLGALVFLSLM
jgi:hypothetical protein